MSHQWLIIILSLSASLVMAQSQPDYKILTEYPEDKRGFNLKAFWSPTEKATSYKLRVFRKDPTPFNTVFSSKDPFFFFKMYPWRTYEWDVQAFDKRGTPLSEPIPGRTIYLESQLFSKETNIYSEYQEEDQAQSYVTEDGEPSLLDNPPVEIQSQVPSEELSTSSPLIDNNPSEEREAENSNWYPQTYQKISIGFGLGATSYAFEQTVSERAGLDFSNVTLPSYHLFINGQWNRWLAFLSYKSLPGSIKSETSIDGGSNYEWNRLQIGLAFQAYKFDLFGKESILSPRVDYQKNNLLFIFIDSLDGLNRQNPSINTIAFSLSSQTSLNTQWSIPLQIGLITPLSGQGDGGSLNSVSGTSFMVLSGLKWEILDSWSLATEVSFIQYNIDFESSIDSSQQRVNQSHQIVNSELQLIYNF